MKIVTTSKEVFDAYRSQGEWELELRPDGSQLIRSTNYATRYFEFVLYIPEQILRPEHLVGYVDQLPFTFITKGRCPEGVRQVILGQRSVLIEC